MFTRIMRRSAVPLACAFALAFVPRAAHATTFSVSGTLSGTYPVSAKATFVTSGSTLALTLQNTSTFAPTSTPTSYPAQVLSSFYFDLLINGTGRPTLTYTSGSGNVFKITGTSAAVPYLYVPPTTSGTAFTPLPIGSPQPSDIRSSMPGDNSWYFRSDLNEALAPFCRFGIGTVGNSLLTPNEFPAPYVDQIDFGIFAGDGSNPQGNLQNLLPYLVKDSATFTFTADRDLTNFEFTDPFVFGFGTGPDQTVSIVPEPGGLGLLMGVGVAVLGPACRRRRRDPHAPPRPG